MIFLTILLFVKTIVLENVLIVLFVLNVCIDKINSVNTKLNQLVHKILLFKVFINFIKMLREFSINLFHKDVFEFQI